MFFFFSFIHSYRSGGSQRDKNSTKAFVDFFIIMFFSCFEIMSDVVLELFAYKSVVSHHHYIYNFVKKFQNSNETAF